MTNIPFLSSIVGALLVVAMSLPAAAQSVVGKGKTGPVPDPVNLDITGLFQAKYASVGSDLFIGGQPTEKALRDLKAKGVTFVPADKAAYYKATQPIRDKYGVKYAALLKRIEETK